MTTSVTQRPTTPDRGLGADIVLAVLLAGAGAIHLAMVPVHAEGIALPVGFAVVGWLQLVGAGLLVARRSSPTLYAVIALGNLGVLAVWAWSRIVGLPVGSHAGTPEPVAALDLMTAGLEVGAIVLALGLLVAADRARLPALSGLATGLVVAALVTAVIASPEASSHGHGGGGAAGDHHGGGDAETIATGDHDAEMTLIDETRCDIGYNPVAYWDETQIIGIDSYTGGAMTTGGHGEGHAGSESIIDDVTNQPLDGRGSEQLDRVIGLASNTESEGAAAAAIVELADTTDEEYAAWLAWLREEGSDHGSHGSDDTEDEDSGTSDHGEHLGPQAWTAMVDQEQCDQLGAELETAREVALSYPTVADAQAGGWFRVTGYVAGIAAHYMNFGLVDGRFDVREPEMLLYDGTEPDSQIVGLSYFLSIPGEAEPSQGFTGENDRTHRHLGLCIGAGGVVGDSATTEEECSALGGFKSEGTGGWMSHAWVVPGCESPWGVFSGVNPILDAQLEEQTGQNEGGCSASAVLDRYDLTPGERADVLAGAASDLAAGGD